LQQIASNLLVNAVKFTPEGKSIEVILAARDEHAELTVAEEGIGIDPAFKPQLFQRFRQADTGSARQVEATSEGPGMGSTFVVRLPLSRKDAVWPPVDPQPLSASNDQSSLTDQRHRR